MFLPDVKQINQIWQNDSKLGGNNYYIGYPTAACVNNSTYKSSSLTTTARWWSWLRSPDAFHYGDGVRCVDTFGDVYHNDAYYSHGGVRPAFYLNLTSCRFTSGSGTLGSPYKVYGSGKTDAGTSDSQVTSPESPTYETDDKKIVEDLSIDTENLLKSMSVQSDTIHGPSLTVWGKTFYLFEMDGKVDLDIGSKINIQLNVDKDKKTVQLLGGFYPIKGSANIGASYNDGDTYWSKSYQQTKDLYKTVTGSAVDTTALWNKFSSLRGQLKELDADLVVNAKGKVALFAEISFETGKAQLTEGGAIISASIGGEFLGRVPAPFSFCYCTLGLNASLDGQFTLLRSLPIDFSVKLTPAIAANIGIGVGTKKTKLKTYLEGGVTGKLYADIFQSTNAEEMAKTNWLTVKMKAYVYAKGAFLGYAALDEDWDIGEPVQLYPWNGLGLMSIDAFDGKTTAEIIKEATPLERNYLNAGGIALMSIDDDNVIYSDKAVYDYNQPVIEQLSDGSVIMIYLDDDGTKSDINKTTLFYVIYKDGVFTEPQKVYEDGAYNDSAAICQNGGKLCLVWEKATAPLSDGDGLEKLIESTGLYYSEFVDGAFTEPIEISRNGKYKTAYTVISNEDETAAIWIENSQNDVYSENGENLVKQKIYKDGAWSEETTVFTTSKTISELNAAYVNGAPAVSAVYVNGDNDLKVKVTGLDVFDGSNAEFYNNKIYYLRDNVIYSRDLNGGDEEKLGAPDVSNFTIYDGDIYAVLMAENGVKSELYVSRAESGYAAFEQITAFDKYVRDFSIAKDSGGNNIYAMNIVAESGSKDKAFGISELAVCTEATVDDISLSAVYYDYEDITPGGTLPITLDVVNNGNRNLSGVTVKIKNKSGTVLTQKTFDVTTAPGATESVTIDYALPEKIVLSEITLEATAYDTEKDLSDNTQKISYGYGDAEVSDLSVERKDGKPVLSGKVSNNGYTGLSNVTVYVTDAGDVETKLCTLNCGNLAAQKEYEFELELPQKYLTLEDKLTMYGVKVFAETTSEEASLGNNDDKVVFGNLAERTIALCDGTEILDIVAYSEFNSYRYRKSGYKLNGWDDGEGNLYKTIDSEPSENLVLFADFAECSDDFSIYDFSIERTESGTKAVLDFDYTNKAFRAVCAVYDGGKLVSRSMKDVKQGDKTADFATSEKLGEKYYSAKLFCWADDYSPIGELIEKTVYLNLRTDTGVVLESDHDYAANCDKTYTYKYDGLCRSLEVTFTEDTDTEEGVDYIYIYDKDDTQIGAYSGSDLAGKTVILQGDTVKIRLKSDASLQAYGFKTESIIVNR